MREFTFAKKPIELLISTRVQLKYKLIFWAVGRRKKNESLKVNLRDGPGCRNTKPGLVYFSHTWQGMVGYKF